MKGKGDIHLIFPDPLLFENPSIIANDRRYVWDVNGRLIEVSRKADF